MIKTFIKNLRNTLMWPLKYINEKKAVKKLKNLSIYKDSLLNSISKSILETINNEMTLIEKVNIDLIERRRADLLNSTKIIEVIDYGAGSPESFRTKEEMIDGVKSESLVSEITIASKPKFWATLLFKIIRNTQPKHCVELGTCVGISAAYQALALRMNGKGNVVTLEGSPEIAQIAIETFKELNIENVKTITGPFHLTLNKVLIDNNPIDLFFNDGHHDHDAVIQYFNESLPYLSENAIMIFDDINWSNGMRKAWKEIEEDQRVSISIDLHSIGLIIIRKIYSPKLKIKIPLK